MKLNPIGEKVIIQVLDAEGKTAGGIILPDSAQERPQKGTVIAVGKGKTLKNGTVVTPPVKKGDSVFFAKYSGSKIAIDSTEYLIVDGDEIIALVG